MSLKKYVLINVIGFGLGGLLWGWILYRELPDLEYPFHFMAIIIMGLFGGISLVWYNRSVKEISKSVLAGFLGYTVGFLAGGVLVYPLALAGALILSSVPYIRADLIILEPNIDISGFWLVFLLIGAVVGLFYALFLKIKKWPLIWRGGVGFALGSLIGPVIGNILGNAFDCPSTAYLVTFPLIGIILGKFLAWGVYKYRKE